MTIVKHTEIVTALRQWGASTLNQAHATVQFDAADAIEELTSNNNNLLAKVTFYEQTVPQIQLLLSDANKALQACSLDADEVLRRDAARYRYWREAFLDLGKKWPTKRFSDCVTPGDVDEAMNDAMQDEPRIDPMADTTKNVY